MPEVSVNSTDGSCWTSDNYVQQVAHFASDGTELWHSLASEFYNPTSISVNSGDDSCWVADTYHAQVVHLSSAGTELWRSPAGTFFFPAFVAVNSADGSCWVADWGYYDSGSASEVGAAVVHLSAAGAELWRSADGAFTHPAALSVDPTDGSCWVADGGDSGSYLGAGVVHLSSAGQTLWKSASGQFYSPSSLSVNSADSSCWVADSDYYAGAVVHLSSGGTELWRSASGQFATPGHISVNPADGSCWVSAYAHTTWDYLFHLSSTGSTLWTCGTAQFGSIYGLSVNSSDGSCWLVGGNAAWAGVAHVSSAGAELWRSANGDFFSPSAVSASPRDGACWVLESYRNRLVKLGFPPPAADFSATPVSGAKTLTVQFTDLTTNSPTSWSWDFGDGGSSTLQNASHAYTAAGTYTVALTARGVHGANTASKVGFVKVSTFSDVLPDNWAWAYVEACVAAGITSGYGDGIYGPGNTVTRDQMAVYVARALAQGDANVPAGPSSAHFSDVATGYWAFKYVEYVYAQNIVAGNGSGGYDPGGTVDRDQMAVFIARSIVTPHGEAGLSNYTPPATPSFPDVAASYWAFKYIEYIKQANITGGCNDGKYHPEYAVTRDQMAVFVTRAFGL